MRNTRAILILILSFVAIWLLVGQLPAGADLPAVMERHGLRSASIAYGRPGDAPSFHMVDAQSGRVLPYWSLSKPITAAVVLKGVDQGLISLDEQVAGARVADILRHAGGWDREIAGDPVYEDGRPPHCVDMKVSPRQFEPGARAAYSNLGYCLLGKLIEERFGKPYPEVVQDLFPETAGMKYDPWLGPAGGWSGSAAEYFAFAVRPIGSQALQRPSFAPKGPYYAMGWRVLEDDTLSHYGLVTNADVPSFALVLKRPDWVAVALFEGTPPNGDAARRDLLPAIEALSR